MKMDSLSMIDIKMVSDIMIKRYELINNCDYSRTFADTKFRLLLDQLINLFSKQVDLLGDFSVVYNEKRNHTPSLIKKVEDKALEYLMFISIHQNLKLLLSDDLFAFTKIENNTVRDAVIKLINETMEYYSIIYQFGMIKGYITSDLVRDSRFTALE